MKIGIEKIKESFSRSNIQKKIAYAKKETLWLFYAALLALCVYGGYLWISYVYRADWSEDRKTEYLRSKDKETIFNETKFNEIVEEKERREANYQVYVGNWNDIFKLSEKKIEK